ncbi:TetR/AcrR family transcriptional regulator [Rhizobium leguminosarum]
MATDLEQSRTRILEVAERHFRRIGYHKTSVADIAAELGMSRANIYRFFPSRTAINSSVCGLVVKEVAEIALAIARSDAPASKRLADLLAAIHRHSTRRLAEDRPMHQLLVAAMDGSWATINAHNEDILAILKALVREGLQTGEFKVENADEAARGIITAFLPFFHPVLIEQRVQEGEDTAAVHAQISFIMKALGTSDRHAAPSLKGISASGVLPLQRKDRP